MAGKTCVNVIVDVPGVGDRPYSYYLPETVPATRGLMLSVPFGAREAVGFVIGEAAEPEGVTVKDVTRVYDARYLPPPHLLALGESVARYYAVPVASVWRCLWPPAVPASGAGRRKTGPGRIPHVSQSFFSASHGATASRSGHEALLVRGDTSFRFSRYVELIREELERGFGVLCLFPEVRLLDMARRRFFSPFEPVLAEIHSEMTDRRRRDEWTKVSSGEKRLVLATRAGVFVPVRGLSLIVVDSAEEDAFKAEDHPRYDVRTVSEMRAVSEGARLLFGAGRLSVALRYGWDNAKYRMMADAGPKYPANVHVVERRRYGRKGKILSWKSISALEECFEKGGKAFVFLNQRGYARSLYCAECGYAPACDRCSTVLSLHSGASLLCHVCGFEAQAPSVCPRCGGYDLRPWGFGTERLEEEISRSFPGVPLFRVDRDAARKEDPRAVIERFLASERGCLVGTELGLGLLGATAEGGLDLVVAAMADSGLRIPGFNVEETVFLTLSKLCALVREESGVLIAEVLDSSRRSVRWLAEKNEEVFYEEEIRDRKALGYPPAGVLALLELAGKNVGTVKEKAEFVADSLRREAEGLTVLGPAPCIMEKARGVYRWQILIKGQDRAAVTLLASRSEELLRQSGPGSSGVKLVLDVDPVGLR